MNQNNIIYSKHSNNRLYFDFDDYFITKVDISKQEKFTNIYHFYKKFELEKLGFIKAELVNQDSGMFLKIKKLINSHPHEWTMSMLQDATLFHLKLFEKLYSLNLALKSSSLENITFDFTKPIFSDLTTLSMRDEETLMPLSINEGELKNVVHKILLVIELIQQKKYGIIRQILQESRYFILRKKMIDIFLQNPGLKASWEESVVLHSAKISAKKSFVEQCEYLYDLAASINTLTEDKLNYHVDKNFDLSSTLDLENKQKNIHKIITTHFPETILNISVGSEWISFMAEKERARVISIGTNEYASDIVYRTSKINNLNILSLVMPFSSISTRTSCSMVFALGVLHKLVFEQNMQLDYIFKTLAAVAKNTLILDFVNIPTQAQNISIEIKNNYNIDVIMKCGLKYFNSAKLMDSGVQADKLLVFEK